jgi:hypothetical protein
MISLENNYNYILRKTMKNNDTSPKSKDQSLNINKTSDSSLVVSRISDNGSRSKIHERSESANFVISPNSRIRIGMVEDRHRTVS